MSSQKKKIELLTYGYIKQSDSPIPIVITNLIRLFYDIYFYVSITNNKRTQFINSEIGDCVFQKTIKTKGIILNCMIYPNGKKSSQSGVVVYYLCLIKLPLNIEYAGIYFELNCEAINFNLKRFATFTELRNKAAPIIHLSKVKDLNELHFDGFIDIKYIKYKQDHNIQNFTKAIKMQKTSEFLWKIDGELLNKCKSIEKSEHIISDTFGNNNWCLDLFGKTTSKTMRIFCLTFPFKIKTIEIKCEICVVINQAGGTMSTLIAEKNVKIDGWKSRCSVYLFCVDKTTQLISINVKLEIVNLWNDMNEIVVSNDWSKHDILINNDKPNN